VDAHCEPECFIRVSAQHVGEPARIDVRGSVSDLALLLASALGETQFQGPLIDAFVLLGGPQVLNPLGELGRAVSRSQTMLRERDPAIARAPELVLANGVPGGNPR
jgi:hypothetical protein